MMMMMMMMWCWSWGTLIWGQLWVQKVKGQGNTVRKCLIVWVHVHTIIAVCRRSSNDASMGSWRRTVILIKLWCSVQARRLTLFGHIARRDDNIAVKQILISSPVAFEATSFYVDENGPKWPGLPQTHTDWSNQLGSELTALEAVGD